MDTKKQKLDEFDLEKVVGGAGETETPEDDLDDGGEDDAGEAANRGGFAVGGFSTA